jgi:hypothetical protein
MTRQRTLFENAEDYTQDPIQTSSQKTDEPGTLSGGCGDGAGGDRESRNGENGDVDTHGEMGTSATNVPDGITGGSDGEGTSPGAGAPSSPLGPSKARTVAQSTLPSIPALSEFPHAKDIATPEEVKATGGTVKKTEGRGTHAGTTYHRYKIEGPIVLNEQIQKSVSAGPLPVGEPPDWEEGVGLSDEGAIRRDMLRIEERIGGASAEVTASTDRMHVAYLRRIVHDPSPKARPRIWLTFHDIAEWAHEKESTSKGEGPQIYLYAIAQHILDAFDISEGSSSWPKAIARRLREGSLDLHLEGEPPF